MLVAPMRLMGRMDESLDIADFTKQCRSLLARLCPDGIVLIPHPKM